MQTSSHLGPPIFPTIRLSERFRNRHQGEVEKWIANFNVGKRSFASEFGEITVNLRENKCQESSSVYYFSLDVRLHSLSHRNQGFEPDIFVHGEIYSNGKIGTYKMMISKFVFSAGQMPSGTEHDLMLEKLASF